MALEWSPDVASLWVPEQPLGSLASPLIYLQAGGGGGGGGGGGALEAVTVLMDAGLATIIQFIMLLGAIACAAGFIAFGVMALGSIRSETTSGQNGASGFAVASVGCLIALVFLMAGGPMLNALLDVQFAQYFGAIELFTGGGGG